MTKTISEIAKNEIGNNGSKYRKWFYGSDIKDVAWCAVFVSWCLKQSGVNDIKTDGAGCFARDYSNMGKWYESEYTNKNTTPKVNDIITFVWNYDGRYHNQDIYYSDHVGIVYDYDNDYVYTIEGNVGQNNDTSTVQYRKYLRKSGCINGYFRLNTTKGGDAVDTELKKGDKNIAVYFLKQCLIHLKRHHLITQSVDNNDIFGVGTEKAVKQVQSICKIDVDGIVGNDTKKAINTLLQQISNNYDSAYDGGYDQAIYDAIEAINKL